jgi:rhodanese-related sulfurtransferase
MLALPHIPNPSAEGEHNVSDTITPKELAEMRQRRDNFVLIDVRRQDDFEKDPSTIPGAIRRLPESVESWASELPAESPVVVYCVRGGSVSQSVTPALRGFGLDATYVEGGIEAWVGGGGDVEPADQA